MSQKQQPWRALLRQEAFLAGTWISSAAEPITVHNPADGSIVGTVPALQTDHVQQAIAAAAAALPRWRALLPRERTRILTMWHDAIVEQSEALALLLTAEQGKTLKEAQGEIAYGASFVKWFAEEANRSYGEVIPSHLPDRHMRVERTALGVVALVTPWNFPSAMLMRKAAAALAAGCTAIAVPSNEAPFSALALALLAERAGFPPGTLSVLTGDPPTVVGALCDSPTVRGLSFTGSTEIGKQLMARCAPTLKRLSLELGGHAPFIVFPDADVEEAAAAAVNAKYQTSGQDCLAANRIFVHQSIYEPFVAAFTARARALQSMPGMDAASDLGPLINERTAAKSAEHIADAVEKGARLLSGGGRTGLCVQAAVLADVTPAMKIMHEETFGPVAALLAFEDESAVIEAANNTDYGLVAYIYTRDIGRAHRVCAALEFGMVAINTMQLTGAPIPFGGVKHSGFGREGSRHGIDEFTQLKYVCTAF